MTEEETIDLDSVHQSAADSGFGRWAGRWLDPEGVVTRLDQGSGWVLDVVRPRASAQAAVGAAPAAS